MGPPVRVSLDATAIPARPAGGGRYVVELARALGTRPDVDVTVLARRGDGGRWRALPGDSVVEQAPASRPARLAWEQVVLPRQLGRLPVDLHHAPHYTMPRRARLPTVVTIHDLTFFDHPEWHERVKAPPRQRPRVRERGHGGASRHPPGTGRAGARDPPRRRPRSLPADGRRR